MKKTAIYTFVLLQFFLTITVDFGQAGDESFLQDSEKSLSLIKKIEKQALSQDQESQICLLALLAQQAKKDHFAYMSSMRRMGAMLELDPFSIEERFLEHVQPYAQMGVTHAVSVEKEIKKMIETNNHSRTLLSVIFSYGCDHQRSCNLDNCEE